MAKLEIKLKDEVKKQRESEKGEVFQDAGLTFSDYEILIDGQEPSHLLDFKLELGTGIFNTATISFAVDELEVDADAITSLKAFVKTEDEKEV